MSAETAQNTAKANPNQLASSISIGVVIGLINVIVQISFGALLFTGDLEAYIPFGIGLVMFGAFITQLIVSLTTSYDGMISVPQDSPAALLGIELAFIGSSLAVGTSQDVMFYTAVASIALTSLLTGLVYLLLGRFNLGVLVRYIPYPVVAGFLAGTGWFLFKGGFGIAANASFSLGAINELLAGDLIVRWLPAILIGAAFFFALGRFSQFWVLPALFFIVVALFYAVIFLSGSSIAEFQQAGWFLGPFPEGQLWRPVMLQAATQADWGWVISHLPNFSPVIFVSVMAMLLNVSGIELMVRKDIDLNHELRSNGIANIFGALAANIVSFPALSLSVLGHRSGARSKMIGLVAAAVSLLVLLVGTTLLAFIPKPVVGGILIFLGVDFMVQWLVTTYSRLSRIEYAIIWIILLTMDLIGLLEGVGVGLLLALGLFVYSYSQTKVIKHSLSDMNYRSNVDRPQYLAQILYQHPNWLYILELQGYIFFGTAHHLYSAIKARLEDQEIPSPEHIVLDFRYVVGIDASAIQGFQRIIQLVERENNLLIFSALTPELQNQLEKEVLTESTAKFWRTFQDLDHAVEWCEDQKILTDQHGALHETYRDRERLIGLPEEGVKHLAGLVDFLAIDEVVDESKKNKILDRLANYLEELEFSAGEPLIRQGEVTKGLFFIEEGITSVEIADHHGNGKRLRKTQPGTVVGEMSIYGLGKASASVVALEDCRVYLLSRENLLRMEKEEVEVASELHRFIAQLLSYRLSTATETIQALMD